MRRSVPKRPSYPGCTPATGRHGSNLQKCSQGLRTVPKRIHGSRQFSRSGRTGDRSEPGDRAMPGFPNLRLAPPNRIFDLKDMHGGRRPYPHLNYRHARLCHQPYACRQHSPSAVKPQHGAIRPRLPFHPRNLPDAVVPHRPGRCVRENRPCPIAAGLDECTRTCLHNGFGPSEIAGLHRPVSLPVSITNRKPSCPVSASTIRFRRS